MNVTDAILKELAKIAQILEKLQLFVDDNNSRKAENNDQISD